jgi:hypothetical protein
VVFNDGWGKARDCRFRFSLLPDHLPLLPKDVVAAHEQALEDIETMIAVDVKQALLTEGVDLDQFREKGRSGNIVRIDERSGVTISLPEQELGKRYSTIWGRFTNGYAKVFGRLDYRSSGQYGEDREYTSFILSRVPLRADWRVGEASPPSAHYSIKLEYDRSDYRVTAPISHSLKPNEADRFTVKLHAERSSTHDLRLSLMAGDKVFHARRIALGLFSPRSWGSLCTERQ